MNIKNIFRNVWVKRITLGIILVIIITYAIAKNIRIDAKLYFKEKSRGNTMKGQLRYGIFDIWDGFDEVIEYNFDFDDEKKLIALHINIDIFKKDKDNDIDKIIKKELQEVKDIEKNVKENYRKKIKIDGKEAILVNYIYGEFEEYKYITEFCYIIIDDFNIVRIKGYSYKKFYENGKSVWEEFYKSFKTDQSQAYKTKFGSFKIIKGISMRDRSYFRYTLKGSEDIYDITIEYDNSPGERDPIEKSIDFIENMYPGSKLKLNKQKIKIDGKNAVYEEIEIIDTKNKEMEKIIFLRILEGLNPGLIIKVGASDYKIFELYRGEMEALFNSLKFD